MQIKAKEGYNVIINDIDISLLSGKDFIEISDELLESSADFKRLLPLIEVKSNKKATKKDNEQVKTVNSTANGKINIVHTSENMLTIDMDTEKKKSDMLVFTPDLLKDNAAQATILDKEQVKEPAKEIKIEVQPDVKPEPSKKEEIKTESKVEVNSESKTEQKTKSDIVEDKKKVNTDIKAEAKNEVKNDVKANVKNDTKTEAKSETKVDLKTDNKTEDKGSSKKKK